MAVSGGNDEVMRDKTANPHMMSPRTLDKFSVRWNPVSVMPAAKTQPVAGDGVSGGPPAPKRSGTSVYPVKKGGK